MPTAIIGASLFLRLLLSSAPIAVASGNLFEDGNGITSDADDVVVGEGHTAFSRSMGRQTRIIDGYQPDNNRYPYSVSLQDGKGHFCGGSLIGRDVVLTAAHCMGNAFTVQIGSDQVDGGRSYSVRSTEKHPDYDSNSDSFDIALVFLDESTNGDIQFLKVNDNSNFPSVGVTAITMGWGDTDEGDGMSLPKQLNAVNLNVISNNDCESASQGGDSYKGWIYDSMLCTYTKGKDACQGDSGECNILFSGSSFKH
jgi:trypsin